MANLNIKDSQLYELCCICLRVLEFLGVRETDPGEFEAKQLIEKLSNILHLPSHSQMPAGVAHKNSDAISFSLFSAWFVAKLAGQLGSGFTMRTELKKASLLSQIYELTVKTWAASAKIDLIDKEFLVDYYIYPKEHLHCPILTVESESQEDGKFFDLSKLLLVNSPRRVYIANVQTGKLEDALMKITSMLNEALASGAIHNSDQIVFILFKKNVQTVTLQVYDYDQYRHV